MTNKIKSLEQAVLDGLRKIDVSRVFDGKHNSFEKKIKHILCGIGTDISDEVEKQYSETLGSSNSILEYLSNYEPQYAFREFYRQYIVDQLRRYQFNIKNAAASSQKTPDLFRKLMKRAGIKIDEEKEMKTNKLSIKQEFDTLPIVKQTLESYKGMFDFQINELVEENQDKIANYINNIVQKYLLEGSEISSSRNKYLQFPFKEAKQQFRKDYFIQKLEDNNYNARATAKACNITLSNLKKYLSTSEIKIRELKK